LRRAAYIVFALFCGSPLFGEQVFPKAKKAAETIRQLRAIGMPSTRAEENRMPPSQVPALLRNLNTELQGLIVSVLNDQTRQYAPEAKEIFDQLRAAGWDDIPSNKTPMDRSIRSHLIGNSGILPIFSLCVHSCGFPVEAGIRTQRSMSSRAGHDSGS